MHEPVVTGELHALLVALGREPHEKLSINYMRLGVFQSRLTTVEAVAEVALPHQHADLWFGTQVLHPRVQEGRGKARDVVGLRDLTCDLDVKPGGMPDWDAAEAVIEDLSDMLGVNPVAIVHTGHGLQPHWSIERDSDTDWPDEKDPRWLEAVSLWKQWGRLVASVAARRGGAADSVFDLSRVMRAPGTVNRKEPAVPVPVRIQYRHGAPLSLSRLREVCEDEGVPVQPEDREVLGEVVAPMASWAFGGETCNYVAGMVAGWTTDRPDARHPWLVSQSVRLAAAHRLACVAQSDYTKAVEALMNRFRILLANSPTRPEAINEISDALRWGVCNVETMSEDRARQELGSTTAPHQHAVFATVATAAFWQERSILAHIEQFARGRMASPWAVLGTVICRVLVTVPPHVVLPPITGGRASLNTFVALVGPSGSGKGAAEAAGVDAIDVGSVDVQTAGSGEGLVKLFGHTQQGQVVRDRTSVLLSVPEVDNLVALKTRMGATIMPLLRSGWSGEKIGFSYADPTKAVQIEPHTYRLCMLLGVQPGRAEPLLDDADGGTPQRFVWLPATDPEAPDLTPAAPSPVPVPSQTWPSASQGLFELVVPDVAFQTVRAARLAGLRGSGEALNGHALLTRLKVAQALTFLDRRRVMTEDDWRLAGVVMQVSERTRSSVVQHLSDEAEQTSLRRGKAEGKRAAVADDVKDEHAVQRVCRNVLRHLADGELASSELSRRLASRDRDRLDDVLDRLVGTGFITITELNNGKKIGINP